VKAEVVFVGGRDVRKHLNVSAGAEELSPLPVITIT
jgi:hypothetical protein